MAFDVRLLDVSLLTLAAMRAQHRREAARTQPPDWRQTEGLASLLAAAKALPRRDPWDLPALEGRSGLAGLLAEARQKEQTGGASAVPPTRGALR